MLKRVSPHPVSVRAGFSESRHNQPIWLVSYIAGTIAKITKIARVSRYFEQPCVATRIKLMAGAIIKPATYCTVEGHEREPCVVGIRHHNSGLLPRPYRSQHGPTCVD